jgi:hypothetical protein
MGWGDAPRDPKRDIAVEPDEAAKRLDVAAADPLDQLMLVQRAPAMSR